MRIYKIEQKKFPTTGEQLKMRSSLRLLIIIKSLGRIYFIAHIECKFVEVIHLGTEIGAESARLSILNCSNRICERLCTVYMYVCVSVP